MCFWGTECIAGPLQGILLSARWLKASHHFWLGQDLDICHKASDQNNRRKRASVALKKCSLHFATGICLHTYMLHLCYKEIKNSNQRAHVISPRTSLGMLQGHRPNAAPQGALSKISSAWSIALLWESQLCSKWNARTILILKRECLRRSVKLLGFELEMLTALCHMAPKDVPSCSWYCSYCVTHD